MRTRGWRLFASLPLTRLLVTLGMLLFVVAACGRNRVTADVDIDSFVDPGDLTGTYDAPPVPGLQLEAPPTAINLVDGLSGVGPPEELELAIGVQYDNVSGEGSARFTLFFAENAADVYNTLPVGSLDAELLPQTTTTRSARIAADPRVLDLFQQERLYIGLRFQWAPESAGALQGDYTITFINAHVVSTVQIF